MDGGMPLTDHMTPMAVLLSLEGYKIGGGKAHVNQDRAFIHEISQDFTVFAVFDGHGEHGHIVSTFISSFFQQLIINEFPSNKSAEYYTRTLDANKILAWLRSSFTRADAALISQKKIDCSYSGCTASIAVRHRSTIYIGYIGDSKVAGFQFHGKRPLCLIETPEHSPGSKTERLRINQIGAHVSETHFEFFTRPVTRIVEAGLSVSRAFGDLSARPYGLVAEPEFIQIGIPEWRHGKKYFPLLLVVATDGVWDTTNSCEILDFISNAHQSKDKLFESLKTVAEIAWRRRLAVEGRSDDTTAICALLF